MKRTVVIILSILAGLILTMLCCLGFLAWGIRGGPGQP